MSVGAKLVIEDQEINVLWFSFEFNKSAGKTGRPAQDSVFSGLHVAVESSRDVNFMDWAFSRNDAQQIELHISPIILGGKTRKLYFYDCHLLSWNNDFSSEGTQPLTETLHISVAGVKDSKSSAEYAAYWRETFLQPDVEATTIDDTKELILVSAHFEDGNNQMINEKYNGKATLVIETKNGLGKVIDIDLSNANHDFKYMGKIITDDVLKEVSIAGDTMRLELEIIEE